MLPIGKRETQICGRLAVTTAKKTPGKRNVSFLSEMDGGIDGGG